MFKIAFIVEYKLNKRQINTINRNRNNKEKNKKKTFKSINKSFNTVIAVEGDFPICFKLVFFYAENCLKYDLYIVSLKVYVKIAQLFLSLLL